MHTKIVRAEESLQRRTEAIAEDSSRSNGGKRDRNIGKLVPQDTKVGSRSRLASRDSNDQVARTGQGSSVGDTEAQSNRSSSARNVSNAPSDSKGGISIGGRLDTDVPGTRSHLARWNNPFPNSCNVVPSRSDDTLSGFVVRKSVGASTLLNEASSGSLVVKNGGRSSEHFDGDVDFLLRPLSVRHDERELLVNSIPSSYDGGGHVLRERNRRDRSNFDVNAFDGWVAVLQTNPEGVRRNAWASHTRPHSLGVKEVRLVEGSVTIRTVSSETILLDESL